MKGRIAAGNLHLHGHHFYNRYVPPPQKIALSRLESGLLPILSVSFAAFIISKYCIFLCFFPIYCSVYNLILFRNDENCKWPDSYYAIRFFYLIYWNWSSLRAVLHWRWGLLVCSEWTRSAGSYCCVQSTNNMNFVTGVQRSKVAHLTRPKIDQAAYIDVGKKSAHAVQERFTS